MDFLKHIILNLFLIFLLSHSHAQSIDNNPRPQNRIDSLKQLFSKKKDLNLLVSVLQEEPNPDSILKYSKILLKESFKDSTHLMTYHAFLHLGNGHAFKGELSQALKYYFQSMKYAEKAGYEEGRGKLFVTIADIYSQSENSENAVIYYSKSIEILRNGKDSLGLAMAIFNAGDEYLNMKKLDSALIYTKEAQTIFEKVNYPIGDAYSFGNLGMIYAENGNKTAAEENINQAVRILEEYKEYAPISAYLEFMSSIFLDKGDQTTALEYAERSLNLAKRYGIKSQNSQSNLMLSRIYEKIGDTPKAFDYYKNYIFYRDSVNNITAIQEMADLRTDYEVSQKQIEVDLLEKEATINSLKSKRQQFILYGVLALLASVGIVAFITFRRYMFERETKLIIEVEKNRSERLLLNILPAEIADELKNVGKVKAHRYNSATVLFTDFKSFSSLAENISPENLVESIDHYFKKFDEITTIFKLEKIKTIGDSYMCAGGIPVESDQHALKAVKAAKAMMDFIKQPKPDDIIHFEMRIGIHTGPIVAGIVGVKKWQYDIWGDTVNIASRMETHSLAGRINISETTYQLVKDEFECEYRGSIDVKNRGVWKMYFLKES
jgi:adenylate cyclase